MFYGFDMRVCIVVPMYNEAVLARLSLETIIGFIPTLSDTTTVCVVDDGSRDATPMIVEEVRRTNEGRCIRYIAHQVNRGYGAALRTGIRFAIDGRFDYAVFMDSDLTNHPKYLAAFYEKMREGCEYIKATRYRPGGGMEGVPRKRRLFSYVGNRVGSFLFRLPLTDVTNGFRAVKVSILERLHLREDGFPIIMEELSQAKKFVRSFCEVPYILTDRKTGQGKTHFSYTLHIMITYFRYAFIAFFYGRPT